MIAPSGAWDTLVRVWSRCMFGTAGVESEEEDEDRLLGTNRQESAPAVGKQQTLATADTLQRGLYPVVQTLINQKLEKRITNAAKHHESSDPPTDKITRIDDFADDLLNTRTLALHLNFRIV